MDSIRPIRADDRFNPSDDIVLGHIIDNIDPDKLVSTNPNGVKAAFLEALYDPGRGHRVPS